MNNEDKILELLTAMQARQEKSEELLTAMQASMQSMQSDIQKINGRLDSMDERLDSMDGRLSSDVCSSDLALWRKRWMTLLKVRTNSAPASTLCWTGLSASALSSSSVSRKSDNTSPPPPEGGFFHLRPTRGAEIYDIEKAGRTR